MNKIILIALVPVLFLLGCSEDVKSRDWWESHPDEAKTKVAECKESGSDSQNCRNAKEGLFRYNQLNAKMPSILDAYHKMQNKQ
ncbi:EexN family lipoprotein [Proteus mirabilis]